MTMHLAAVSGRIILTVTGMTGGGMAGRRADQIRKRPRWPERAA